MTLLKLTETDRQTGRRAGGRAGTSKYRDACASKKAKILLTIKRVHSKHYPLMEDNRLVDEM